MTTNTHGATISFPIPLLPRFDVCSVRDLIFHRENNQEPAFGIKSEKQQWVIGVVGRLDPFFRR